MTAYRPICDVWILARPKIQFYGAYPNGFLERARPLLGVTIRDAVLHVCGGRARDYPNKRRGFGPHDKVLDLDAGLRPDYHQNAQDALPAYGVHCDPAHAGQPVGWPALLADPPYTEADAEQYVPGKDLLPLPDLVLRRMLEAVRPGGRVGMLHYYLPRPPRDTVFVACVGVIVGFGNRMRVFSVFEKED